MGLKGIHMHFVLWIALFALCSIPSPAHAAIQAGQQEKYEKRLQFNELIEEELMKAGLERAEPAKKKIWALDGTIDYGLDNNVTLDSQRVSDMFVETTLEAWGWFDHFGIPGIIRPGQFGIKGFTDLTFYQREQGFDRHIMSIMPYAENEISDRFFLGAEYEYSIIRYIYDNQLDYKSHRLRPSISFAQTDNLTHEAFQSVEFKDYRDRHALTVTNSRSETSRRDQLYEWGYSALYNPSNKLFVRGTLAWNLNESNDQHLDFNDYERYRISAFVYYVLTERLSWAGSGGVDFKEYDDRTFVTNSTKPERDNYFYLGSYFYWAWTDKIKLTLSYFYGQNDSNDPAQEYSGSTFTAGFQFPI